MLQNIRDNAQGMVAKIIIGLIVISFAFFGVESLIGGGSQYVASINGDEISPMDLNQAMSSERNRRMNMMGENIDRALIEESALRGPALEQLIQQRLLLQMADRADIDVAGNTLDQTIVNMKQFHENGQFSPQLYQNILRSNGLAPIAFKELLRTDLVISQISNGLASSQFITEQELASVAEIVGQKRSFKYMMLPKDKVAANVDVTADEIQQYFDDNASQYMTEDKVKLEYIEVRQQDFFEPVSEEDIRAAYEQEVADLDAAEERRASHILIEINADRDEEQALAQAQEIKQKLDGGEDFEALAAASSDDTGSSQFGGDLGFTTGDTFPTEFEEALFSLELDAISAPVLTDAGYHIIRATEIKTVEAPSYEDRKPMIEEQMKLAAAEAEFVSAVEDLRDLVFNSENLSGPAKELKLAVSKSDWLSRTTAKGALADTRVLNAAFSEDVLIEGNNSEVIELAEDHFIVINVLEHDAPHQRALSEVSDSIRNILTRREITQQSQALAADTVAAINAGKSLDDIAAELGGSWIEQESAGRASMALNRELLTAIFALPAPAEQARVESVTLATGDVAVVILQSLQAGQLADFSDAEKLGIKGEIERALRSASNNSLMSTLRANADIEIL